MGSGTEKPKGVFLNSKKANCSIYESGRMAYQCLSQSARYQLTYQEISKQDHLIDSYDFYVFNYHHATMSWLNTRSISRLPGLKATLVLETLPNDPFVLCPDSDFDIYCALDPTMNIEDKRVYAFPRPLEDHINPPVHKTNRIPVIGSFGFATPGKGFELVVDAVGLEFEKAIVRINIPPGTYTDKSFSALQNQNYTRYLTNLCHKVARKGIEVVISNDYMTKDELINWCSENTLNCFLYNRMQPGLAATTDQAISSGRPLAVSANETFRHIHQYLTPYPKLSLRDAISSSTPKVLEMQQMWRPNHFTDRFETVLEDQGLLEKKVRKVREQTVPKKRKRPILIVTHEARQCGIAQYGVDIAAALNKSSRYDIALAPCADRASFEKALASRRFEAILYNYYPLTMPWLDSTVTRQISIPQMGVMHEVTQNEADDADRDLFDFHLCPDPTLIENNPSVIRTKRLIPPYINMKPVPRIPTIGSFGFGFKNKGFERIIRLVQDEFDEAVVFLHMPFNDIVDPDGAHHALATAKRCQGKIHKPGIKLVVNHDFVEKADLLNMLAGNTVNVFCYDRDRVRGISSVIDSALAVQRPIALTRCGMFRHMYGANPSIFLENSSLRQIIENGIAPLVPFYNEWSETAFITDFERIFESVLNHRHPLHKESLRSGANTIEINAPSSNDIEKTAKTMLAPMSVREKTQDDMKSEHLHGTVSYNRILDDTAREQYAHVIKKMQRLVPDMMKRKIPEANVQQAFVLDTVERFAPQFASPKILCVGSHEDTAAASLKRLGYRLEEIDPAVNYDLNSFFHLPSTPKGSYDIIFSTSVLEHVEDDERFMSQLSELVAPGGIIILTVDYNDQYKPGDSLPQEDFRFYTQRDLKERLTKRLSGCSLVGTPEWSCPDPDFVYAGCHYTFATFVAQKNMMSDPMRMTTHKRLTLVNVSKGFETGIMPLGLASISAYIKKYGGESCEIRLLDAHAQDIYKDIENADIFGIGANTQTINQAVRFAEYVKSLYNVPIVLGGVHITTHRTLPAPFDIGVLGEGEQTMLELMQLDDFSADNLRRVKGICFNENGNTVFTSERELLAPLDRIPMPDRDIMDLEHYLQERQIIPYHSGRSLTLITSRGCPFSCGFCSTRIHWKKFRAFSAQRVVDEMEVLINRYHAEIIHIFDDLFIADKKRLKEIHSLVVEKGIQKRAKFMCLVRADMIDDETMKTLKEMNVVVTGVGMESGAPSTLKRLKKNTTTVEDNRRTIELSKKYRIPTMGTFMVGNPEETEEELLQTLEFIREYRDTVFFTPLTYISTAFPGTEFWSYAEKRGIKVDDYDHILMDIPNHIDVLRKAPLLTDIPLEKFFNLIKLFAKETGFGIGKQNWSKQEAPTKVHETTQVRTAMDIHSL